MRSSLQSELATNSKSRHAMKKFSDLTEREVLAVAIASEEEDGRIYMRFAENLAERYPESARISVMVLRNAHPDATRFSAVLSMIEIFRSG
jgi:nitrogen regulatory protein PII-like uncharacterized protein